MDEKDRIQQEIQQQLTSSKWYEDQADILLKKYRECPTLTGQSKMIPQLESMIGKIRFQLRELKKYKIDGNL